MHLYMQKLRTDLQRGARRIHRIRCQLYSWTGIVSQNLRGQMYIGQIYMR